MEDGHILAIAGDEFGAVGQARGVDDLGEDCVVHDLCKFFRRHGSNGGAEGFEARVCRCKDCYIGGVAERIDVVCCI